MTTPTSERVRFTIAVDPEVYDAFAELAHAGGVSLSRCIGDWLRDTAEAAQITTVKMNEVRRSPAEAFEIFIRDGLMPGVQKRLADPEFRAYMAKVEQAGAVERAQPAAGRRPVPPSSNTGGKSPGKTRRTR
jgi:hypothetical protein